MPSESRIQQVAILREKLQEAEAVFVCEYRGLTVAKITALRAAIRSVDGEMNVAKNTLMEIALREESMTVPDEMMTGPNAFTIAKSDPAAVAKVIRDFSKEKGNDALIIKGAILGQHVLGADQVRALADLPSRNVLLAQLAGAMISPVRGLVTVLSGTTRGLVTCLSRIKEQKEEQAA
ncbi:MAG: 50S ribosomal protein L10 [Thermovirgaceae bacterium]|nr:50S ribosomal protein L10 [Thermovirgaceae bacterium]